MSAVKPFTEKMRSRSIGNGFLLEADDIGQGPMMDFDFSSMISELNMAIQEKDAALLAAEQVTTDLELRLGESQIGCRELLEQVECLQMQVEEKTVALEQSMQQNELLRENLYELQNRANALEDATAEKDSSLRNLEENLHHYQEESEALKRRRAVTCDLMEQAKQKELVLTEEVEITKRTSFYVQQQASKLSEELKKAERRINSLLKTNQRLEQEANEAGNFREGCIAENQELREKVSTLKSMVENKTFELIESQRELASLREQTGEGWQENHAFGILEQEEDHDSVNAKNVENKTVENEGIPDTPSKSPEMLETQKRDSYDETDLREAKESLENQSLLFMLHEAEDDEETQSAAEGEVDEKISESGELELEDDEDLGSSEDDNLHDEAGVAGNSTSKRNKLAANKDMLIVFLYLTAAAVKCQYSDVPDLKTAELIHLGQDVPFWELYPFFISVIESLKMKNASVEQRREIKSTSKIGGLFSWRKSRELKLWNLFGSNNGQNSMSN